MRKPPPLEVAAEDYRKIVEGTMSEAAWRAHIKELALHNGWQVLLEIPDRAYQVLAKAAQTDRSLNATMVALRGWPDLLLGNPHTGEHIYTELKTQRGRLNTWQDEKIPLLVGCGLPVEIWRPSDEYGRVREVIESE